jgi:hypothetical protein
MMAGWFEMLIILVVLGVGAAIVVAIVAALANNSQGPALVLGGLVFLGLLLGAGLLFALVGNRAVGHVSATPFIEVNPLVTTVSHQAHNGHTAWSFSIGGLFLAGAIIAILAFGARKQAAVAHGATGHRRIWPFVLVPLAALFFLGTVRVQSKRTHYPPPVAINTYPPVRAEKQIAKMDINELMDKVDAPRIALVPAVPEVRAERSPSASDNGKNDSPASPSTKEAALAAETGDEVKEVAAEKTHDNENNAQEKQQNTSADDKTADDEKQGDAEAPLPSTKEITDELAAKVIVRRPAWVDAPPTRTGEVVREVIATDAYATANECYRAADVLLMLKTYERLQELNGSPYAEASLPSISFQNSAILADGTVIYHGYPGGGRWEDYRLAQLNRLGIGPEFVRREVVAKEPKTKQSREYLEQSELSVGPMNRLFVQVEFSPAVDRLLRDRWADFARQERFAMVGTGAISILGLLGCVFGLLKLDTWTKGYYTKRLFLGVPAAIIGGALLFAVLATL